MEGGKIELKTTDLIIDSKTVGKSLLLTEVKPVYEYRNNKRTDNLIGYRYIVAMPDHGLDKISVKIEGEKLMETPDNYTEVMFEELELFVYLMNGRLEIGARAAGISLAKQK